MSEQPKIKVIPKEEMERRRMIEKRAEITMLQILLKRYFPDKVKIIFPQKKNLIDNYS
jgi:hypothetical protein